MDNGGGIRRNLIPSFLTHLAKSGRFASVVNRLMIWGAIAFHRIVGS